MFMLLASQLSLLLVLVVVVIVVLVDVGIVLVAVVVVVGVRIVIGENGVALVVLFFVRTLILDFVLAHAIVLVLVAVLFLTSPTSMPLSSVDRVRVAVVAGIVV